jgi:hypothetical protein
MNDNRTKFEQLLADFPNRILEMAEHLGMVEPQRADGYGPRRGRPALGLEQVRIEDVEKDPEWW